LIYSQNTVKKIRLLQSGKNIGIDDVMCSWRELVTKDSPNGMPDVTKIPRKPEGGRIQVQSSCLWSNWNLTRLATLGGKENVKDKDFQKAYGLGTAITMHLIEDFKDSACSHRR
jgi:hypothetical protein